MVENKISVAIATYNGEKFITKQFDSILSQILLPDEIIVVDDASSDNTIKILNAYALQYPIIKIFTNEENLGATKTFERAVNLCTGEFIILSDQDDIWFKNKIEALVANIGNATLIHHDAKLIDDNDQIIGNSLLEFIDYHHIPNFFTRLMKEGIHGCCLMMKRDVALAAREIPSGFIFHDFFYNLTAAALGEIKTLTQPLMSYRLHNNNACGLFADKSYERAMKDYRKNLNNMQLIVGLSQFADHQKEIQFYIDYYSKFVYEEHSSVRFIFKVAKLLGKEKAFALLVNNIFGSKVIKLVYDKLKK